MKRLTFGALLLLLTGCSEDRVSPTVVANTKSIGVISSVGDQLTISGSALISLGNVWDQGEVPQWGIDRHIVDVITDKLKAHYQVVPVNYSPADFHYDILGAPMLAWDGVPIGKVIRTKTSLSAAPQGNGSTSAAAVDVYVVVVPDKNYEFHTSGLALYRHYRYSNDLYEITASYFVVAIDGHTFEPLAATVEFGSGPADETLWSDTVAGLSSAQQQQLAKNAATMFDTQLGASLQELKLIP